MKNLTLTPSPVGPEWSPKAAVFIVLAILALTFILMVFVDPWAWLALPPVLGAIGRLLPTLLRGNPWQ